jgi:hypothetical protein
MDALVAVLGCSLMISAAVAAFAWYALRARHRGAEAAEAAALQAEIAELRRSQSGPPSDAPTRRD